MTNIYATLTPTNVEARLGFHQIVKEVFASEQRTYHKGFMVVDESPRYDADVAASMLKKVEDGALSDSATEPDTQTKQTIDTSHVNDLRIWTGHYVLDLEHYSDQGWNVGRGRHGEPEEAIQLLLCPMNTKQSIVRGRHICFTLALDTGRVSVEKISPTSYLAVDGVEVNRIQQLDASKAIISVGTSEGIFQYTFVYQPRTHALVLAHNALRTRLASSASQSSQARTVGQWNLGEQVGSGMSGPVHAATDAKGTAVAIKILSRTPQNQVSLAREIATLRAISELPRPDHIVRLIETIPAVTTASNEVCLVLSPLCDTTLSTVIADPALPRQHKVHLFRSALLGVQWLHAAGWMHGDLKPMNIGVMGSRAVLLDFGDASYSPPSNGMRLATPGFGGTVNYLAPERELLAGYDATADVWSMGVVGYQLLHGRHPWKLARNPFREGNEEDRGRFLGLYEACVRELRRGSSSSVDDLLAKMLRIGMRIPKWSNPNGGRRINIHQAVGHRFWKA